jgi:hypothetical protein
MKTRIDWHTRPADIFKKDIVLDRLKRYLKGIGLKDETIRLYLGRVGGFLDFANAKIHALKLPTNTDLRFLIRICLKVT